MGGQQDEDFSVLDGPKLELDGLIDQLVTSAQGVKRAQGRLRSLLRANELVTGHLELVDVLRHIVTAACELADARYGALGIIAPDGSLEQFIHVGIADELADRIGSLPQGKGLLGALITDPKPIRLEQISSDARSVGFPPNHPPMDSFLGVPVRVGEEVYGNLYLTGSKRGSFSAEDEELVRLLASTAGTAISNARIYAEARLSQKWLQASAEIGAQLLADSGEDPLRMVARSAYEIADADLVVVALVTPDGSSGMVEVAIGDGGDELIARQRPLAQMLIGEVIREAMPILLNTRADANLAGHVELLPGRAVSDVGPVMVLPLTGSAETRGTLVISRRGGRPVFTPADVEMASGFASHASIALELSNARSDRQRIALLEDRDRIARDLHDHVIQQLFAIGLSIEGTAAVVDSEQAQRLRDQVADIDRTIRQIRTSIFELRGTLGGVSGATRQRLLELAGELTVALGFAPQVVFAGQVDLVITGDLADDVMAVVREAMTNVAKHAQATTVQLDLSAVSRECVVTITDNGIGITNPARLSGLENLRKRAERRNGSFDVLAAPGGGTRLIWKVPAA